MKLKGGLPRAAGHGQGVRDTTVTRYGMRERPRLDVWEVIDVDDPDGGPLFVGSKEDCREWITFPELRDAGKPADYPFKEGSIDE